MTTAPPVRPISLSRRIHLTLVLLTMVVACGGGTTTSETLAIALAPTLDASGAGFTANGVHFASCSDFCTQDFSALLVEGSVQSVNSCQGPVPLDATSGITVSEDAGASPQVVVCDVQVEVGGGCGGGADLLPDYG